jgi:hypothetical protein
VLQESHGKVSKKASEINLFATDEHRWDTDLAEVAGGRGD